MSECIPFWNGDRSTIESASHRECIGGNEMRNLLNRSVLVWLAVGPGGLGLSAERVR